MYKVMLALEDNNLINDLQALDVFGDASEFEISYVANNSDEAYNELSKKKYDLVICETDIKGMGCLELLKCARGKKLCSHIAFCGKNSDFEYARQGIIHGAFDYFVAPFQKNQFYSAFARIKNKADENKTVEAYRSGEIIKMFEGRDSGIYDYLSNMISEIYENAFDTAYAEETLGRIYETVIDKIFSRNEWLDLYKSSQSFYVNDDLCGSYDKYFKNRLTELFEEYCELYPNVNNDKIEEVILHILNNPESDLKQKTIASEHYINSSYLSTVFSAQTQMRFVDYLTIVKLKRAGWLLQNSGMKVAEVASRLDYKDIGYFSRVFKKQYGVTPTEYRIPDDYTYQI
jgi:two-component system response regulator YesN